MKLQKKGSNALFSIFQSKADQLTYGYSVRNFPVSLQNKLALCLRRQGIHCWQLLIKVKRETIFICQSRLSHVVHFDGERKFVTLSTKNIVKLGQRSHIIIVMPSFSKSSIVKNSLCPQLRFRPPSLPTLRQLSVDGSSGHCLRRLRNSNRKMVNEVCNGNRLNNS